MPVRKIRKSWWVDFRFARDRIRKMSPDNSKAGAEAYEAVLRQRLSKGEPLTGANPFSSKLLFKNFAKEWVETYVKTNNKPSEQKTKGLILNNHLIPFFGDKELKDIKMSSVEQYKTYKLQKLSPKTINNHLAVLSKCLRTAMDWGQLEACPQTKLLKTNSQRLDFLTPIESRQLVQNCHEPMWREMILVALRTGMRLGELFGLDWQDIDFKRKIITVRRSIVDGIVGTPKNNKSRYIPITDEVCRALYDDRRVSGLVFSRKGGLPLSRSLAGNAIIKICKKSGVKRISWHILRHTFASQLATEGVPIPVIKELMGHSSIVMTMRYAHLSYSALSDSVAVLEEAENREMENFGQQVVNAEQLFGKIIS